MKDQPEQDEARLASLEESAEELYEFAPCGYLTTTIDGRIIKVNRTLAEWLGYSVDELTGKRFSDLLSVGGKIYSDTHLNLLLRMQRSVDEIALDLIRKDGGAFRIRRIRCVRNNLRQMPVMWAERPRAPSRRSTDRLGRTRRTHANHVFQDRPPDMDGQSMPP